MFYNILLYANIDEIWVQIDEEERAFGTPILSDALSLDEVSLLEPKWSGYLQKHSSGNEWPFIETNLNQCLWQTIVHVPLNATTHLYLVINILMSYRRIWRHKSLISLFTHKFLYCIIRTFISLFHYSFISLFHHSYIYISGFLGSVWKNRYFEVWESTLTGREVTLLLFNTY